FVVRSCRVRVRRACDLGAGCGVLGMVLATLDPELSVDGIELQPELVEAARRGAALNCLSERVRCVEADVRRAVVPPGGYPLVVANPPYHAVGSGRPSPLAARAAAHHDLACTLPELLAAARRLLTPRGRLAMIYPAERLIDLAEALTAERL